MRTGKSTTARKPHPLNSAKLDELALSHVGRFATTRGKLEAYLARKIRERGWDDEAEPQPAAIAARFVELGYIDDARGVGPRPHRRPSRSGARDSEPSGPGPP